MIKMIWCQDINGGIGLNNKLPWSIKEEMDHFRTTTKNSIVVMGRKTFDSIGRLLPNRTNIILTNNQNYSFDGALIYHDYKKVIEDFKDKDIFIIGGKSIYELFLPYADELIISTLTKAFECDDYLNISLNNFYEYKKYEHELFIVKYYYKKGIN